VSGGIVCNPGAAVPRLGMQAAASLVGADPCAAVVRRRLAAERIAASVMVPPPGLATSTTAALITTGRTRRFARHVCAPTRIDFAFAQRTSGDFHRRAWPRRPTWGCFPRSSPCLPTRLRRSAGPVPRSRSRGPAPAARSRHRGGAAASCHLRAERRRAATSDGPDDRQRIIDCYWQHGAAGIELAKLGRRGALLSGPNGNPLKIPVSRPRAQ